MSIEENPNEVTASDDEEPNFLGRGAALFPSKRRPPNTAHEAKKDEEEAKLPRGIAPQVTAGAIPPPPPDPPRSEPPPPASEKNEVVAAPPAVAAPDADPGKTVARVVHITEQHLNTGARPKSDPPPPPASGPLTEEQKNLGQAATVAVTTGPNSRVTPVSGNAPGTPTRLTPQGVTAIAHEESRVAAEKRALAGTGPVDTASSGTATPAYNPFLPPTNPPPPPPGSKATVMGMGPLPPPLKPPPPPGARRIDSPVPPPPPSPRPVPPPLPPTPPAPAFVAPPAPPPGPAPVPVPPEHLRFTPPGTASGMPPATPAVSPPATSRVVINPDASATDASRPTMVTRKNSFPWRNIVAILAFGAFMSILGLAVWYIVFNDSPDRTAGTIANNAPPPPPACTAVTKKNFVSTVKKMGGKTLAFANGTDSYIKRADFKKSGVRLRCTDGCLEAYSAEKQAYDLNKSSWQACPLD